MWYKRNTNSGANGIQCHEQLATSTIDNTIWHILSKNFNCVSKLAFLGHTPHPLLLHNLNRNLCKVITIKSQFLKDLVILATMVANCILSLITYQIWCYSPHTLHRNLCQFTTIKAQMPLLWKICSYSK